VGLTQSGIQPQYFLTEMVGQFFYNNPVNIILIILAFIALVNGKRYLKVIPPPYLMDKPAFVAGFSFLFRFSVQLTPLDRACLYWFYPDRCCLACHAFFKTRRLRLIPWPVAISLVFMLAVISMAVTQVRYGWVPLKKWKIEDPSADLWGWKQLGEKFAPIATWDEQHFLIDKGSPIFTFRWFPAANFDYYVARPSGGKYMLSEAWNGSINISGSIVSGETLKKMTMLISLL